MTMQTDLERRLAAHYATEAPMHAPDWLLGSTLDIVEITHQRRAFRDGPWRLPIGRPSARLIAAALVILALAAIGIGVGALRNVPIFDPQTPALTERFTSPLNGIDISYPDGWATRAATSPWTTDDMPLFDDPFMDVIYDPSRPDHLYIGLAFQPLGDEDESEWTTRMTSEPGCLPIERILVGGVPGFVSPGCQLAAVSDGKRGYAFLGYVSGDEPDLARAYDRAWFDGVLATVRLRSEEAASLLPASGGWPLEPGTYTLGDRFGTPITFKVPVGWTPCSLVSSEQAICSSGDAIGPSVTFQEVVNVVAERCGTAPRDPAVGPSVEDLVTAISKLQDFRATPPVDIVVDGYRGKQFEVTAPSVAVCELLTWLSAGRINGVGPGEINLLRILDVSGTRLMIAGAFGPTEVDRPRVEAILDSVRIGP